MSKFDKSQKFQRSINEALERSFIETMTDYETEIINNLWLYSQRFRVPFDTLIIDLAEALKADALNKLILEQFETRYTNDICDI